MINALSARQKTIKHGFFMLIVISLFLRILNMGTTNLLVEEAYYWNYANHLDFGYLDHPPMVALIINVFTSILGNTEWAIRLGALLCWLLTALFSYKLTELTAKGAGRYSVFLLSILPFFFLQSLVMAPDQPLLVCWSAALYYLYKALILENKQSWYWTGLWMGLGMLSKYTILLLGPAAILFLCLNPQSRFWFFRKEPYICAIIVLFLFTPVIYWNATHEWASFVFQSSRRLQSSFYFSFHHILGLTVLFLMPPGLWGLIKLLEKKHYVFDNPLKQRQWFFCIFTFFPWVLFSIFSMTREVKFNWIGPGFLALVPWLALQLQEALQNNRLKLPKTWFLIGSASLAVYCFIILAISVGMPQPIHQAIFKKFIDWKAFTKDLHDVAERIEKEQKTLPFLVAMDLYNINSELAFYQNKLASQGDINTVYQTVGRHIFGGESLMYRYWSPEQLEGKTLLLISQDPAYFQTFAVKNATIEKSPIQMFWSQSQGRQVKVLPYYYQVVEMKT